MKGPSAAALILGLGLSAIQAPENRRPFLASQAAPAGASSSFILDNGLRVVYRRDPASEVTVLLIGVGGGLAAEPVDKPGLAFLTSRLAMDIPDQSKAQDFVAQALHAGLDVRGDGAVIRLECLSGFFDEIAASYSRILSDPLFTGLRIDGIRDYMGHQRRVESDDAGGAARLAHAEAFFPGSGYGRSIFGTEAGLAAVKPKDVKEFHDRLFTAGNMILTVVSDLDEDRLAVILGKTFGRLRRGPAWTPPALAAAVPSESRRDIAKEARQVNISAAFPLSAASRRGYVLNALLENALGRGPGTRLWILRSERRLAYDVGAAVAPLRQAGVLIASLDTDSAKREEARRALDQALEAVWRDGLTAEELEVAKAGLKTSFLRANETKLARAETLDLFESLGLGADFFEAFAAEAEAVGPEEMNAHIRTVLDPARAHWVFVGPASPPARRP